MGRTFGSWDVTHGRGRRLYQISTALISAAGLFILTTAVWSPASAAAATHFSVSAPVSATAGSAFNFTVTALDASDNVDAGYAGTVHFSASDGQAVLPANATLAAGVGTFSATLKTAGNQTITATDIADGSITGTSATTVSAAGATHFQVSTPATASSGVSFSFTVVAQDQFDNTATAYTGTVHFNSSDVGAGTTLPADSTLTNGVGTFSATLVTSGAQTITATDTADASITGTGTVTVTTLPATHFSVSAPASATAGTAFNFTVTALDAVDTTATGYAGTVHFSASDGQAVLPANATLTNGVGTFSATLKTAGTQTITATDTADGSITGTSNAITVSSAAATHLLVSAPASASAGVSFSFTVVAMDQFDNTATGYAGTVHFTSSDVGAGTTLPADSTLTNGVGTFSASLVTGGAETITATDTANASITGTSGAILVTGEADLSLTKSVNNATPNVGDTVTFTLSLSNAGPDTATSVQVTDLLPPGLAFTGATASQGAYNSTTGDWTIGTVAISGSASLQIQAVVSGPGVSTNVATISHSDDFDPNPSNNTASSTVTPLQADVALTKTVSNATPNVGDTVTFTVTASNAGPGAATAVVIHDLLPAGLTFVAATVSQGSYNSTTGDWTIGTLTTATPQTMQIQAIVAGPTPMTNTATVSHADQFDPNPSNNAAAATVVPLQADVALTKTVSNGTPNVGDTVTFTVTALNAGPGAATAVVIHDLLPAGLTFVAATVSQGSYNSTTGDWTIGTLTTATPQTLQLQATVNSTAPITNTATVTHSDQFDPDPANNSASVTLNAALVATSTTLTASPNPGVSGRPVTLTATVVPVPPATGHPTGTVDFFDGTQLIGSAALHSPAVLTTSALAAGTHQLTATYSGNSTFAASTSATLTVTIAPSATTTSTAVIPPPTSPSTQPTTPTTASPGTLPRTGATSGWTGALGALAALIGAVIAVLARRRRAAA